MDGRRAFVFCCVLGLLPLATPDVAHAADDTEPRPLHWDDEWPRFRPAEYVVTGVTGAVALGEYFLVPPQAQPHWVGGILFDDAVRDALRVTSPSGLRTVWAISDIVDAADVVIVVGVDSILVPVLRGSPDVAWQLLWMDAEAFSLGSVVTFTMYDTIGRARPSYQDCQANPSANSSCNVSPTASFPSGHIAEAFMSAGLSCANHGYLPLYGSRLFDGLACARDLTLASSDAVLRIMGDRHYATDAIAGGAIGFAFGFGLPVLLHYGLRRPSRSVALSVAPMGPDRLGVIASGAF